MYAVGLLPESVVKALERGAVVVTANQRAARSLRRALERRNRELGLASWQSPAILAWDAWTAALWRGLVIEGKATRLLLNRTQEHAVWRGVLTADAELKSMRSVDSLADMAAEAWRRLCNYSGRGRLGAGWSADTRAFQRWSVAFERRCRAEGLLSASQLEETLRLAVEAGTVTTPTGGVALIGFDGMTPAQMALVEALRKADVEVVEEATGLSVERLALAEATDESAELEAAVRWVRHIVEQREDARVGVIVPELEKKRAKIDRVFREVLGAELEDIGAEAGGPYEFSLGVALANKPMVTVALDTMRWMGGALPLAEVSALLVSPYFGGGAERGARAEFDAFELRKARMLRPEVTLELMIERVARSKRRAQLSRLLSVLQAMRLVRAKKIDAAELRLHAEWAEVVRELLIAAGWGDARVEDSVEFQLRRKWESALDELATLDFEGVRVQFAQALAAVERIARETTFAPESWDAPVQVMGPLEAAGERFDAVWFLGAGDLNWPGVAGVSPLLPWSLQRELKMPGTDAALDAEHARRITERIARSAEIVVFSYAREAEEGRQRVSPALSGLKLENVTVEELVSAVAARVVVELEEMEDAARIEAPPDVVMRGGATVLQAQAACGFRAFTEMRLQSAELEDIELGMDARERGNVVHKVLEAFWSSVKTQNALQTMAEDEREERLSWAIDEGLKKTAELGSTAWDKAYLDMQRQRLHELLRPWLEFEMERPTFEVKQVEEKLREVKVGPLKLDVRVDRVDETKGGELVIDYKTGLVETSGWLSSRPDEPQLPLYAIVSDTEALGGVAFGLIRPGKSMGMKAFVANEDVLHQPKRAPKMDRASFAEQVDEWRKILTTLAEDFYRGDARVRPKNYPVTCKHCGQRLLCRLDAAALGGEDDFEAETIDG